MTKAEIKDRAVFLDADKWVFVAYLRGRLTSGSFSFFASSLRNCIRVSDTKYDDTDIPREIQLGVVEHSYIRD